MLSARVMMRCGPGKYW